MKRENEGMEDEKGGTPTSGGARRGKPLFGPDGKWETPSLPDLPEPMRIPREKLPEMPESLAGHGDRQMPK